MNLNVRRFFHYVKWVPSKINSKSTRKICSDCYSQFNLNNTAPMSNVIIRNLSSDDYMKVFSHLKMRENITIFKQLLLYNNRHIFMECPLDVVDYLKEVSECDHTKQKFEVECIPMHVAHGLKTDVIVDNELMNSRIFDKENILFLFKRARYSSYRFRDCGWLKKFLKSYPNLVIRGMPILRSIINLERFDYTNYWKKYASDSLLLKPVKCVHAATTVENKLSDFHFSNNKIPSVTTFVKPIKSLEIIQIKQLTKHGFLKLLCADVANNPPTRLPHLCELHFFRRYGYESPYKYFFFNISKTSNDSMDFFHWDFNKSYRKISALNDCINSKTSHLDCDLSQLLDTISNGSTDRTSNDDYMPFENACSLLAETTSGNDYVMNYKLSEKSHSFLYKTQNDNKETILELLPASAHYESIIEEYSIPQKSLMFTNQILIHHYSITEEHVQSLLSSMKNEYWKVDRGKFSSVLYMKSYEGVVNLFKFYGYLMPKLFNPKIEHLSAYFSSDISIFYYFWLDKTSVQITGPGVDGKMVDDLLHGIDRVHVHCIDNPELNHVFVHDHTNYQTQSIALKNQHPIYCVKLKNPADSDRLLFLNGKGDISVRVSSFWNHFPGKIPSLNCFQIEGIPPTKAVPLLVDKLLDGIAYNSYEILSNGNVLVFVCSEADIDKLQKLNLTFHNMSDGSDPSFLFVHPTYDKCDDITSSKWLKLIVDEVDANTIHYLSDWLYPFNTKALKFSTKTNCFYIACKTCQKLGLLTRSGELNFDGNRIIVQHCSIQETHHLNTKK